MNALAQSIVQMAAKVGPSAPPVRIILDFPGIRPWALIEVEAEHLILIGADRLERIKAEFSFTGSPTPEEVKELTVGRCMGIEIERFGAKPDHAALAARVKKLSLPNDWPDLD